MGKAARNRRRRGHRGGPGSTGPGWMSTLGRTSAPEGVTGPLRRTEAMQMLDQLHEQTLMPCRATYLDDPVFGAGRLLPVTDVTTDGQIVTDPNGMSHQTPVLLFEPDHMAVLQNARTGSGIEARITSLVAAGWTQVPPRFVLAGMPADGWGIYRTATGVQLLDPYGCTFAEGELSLDPEWVSAAVSAHGVLVFVGPMLGVRIPPGRTAESYTTRDRAEEFRRGRQNGLLAAATVAWHGGPPEETVTWVLLPEGFFGHPLPPLAYVPLANMKRGGGPQSFGFTDLTWFARKTMQIPVAQGLEARITATDVDLIRAGHDQLPDFVAGHRALPSDPFFPAWRAMAARHQHIMVVVGRRDLVPPQEADPQHQVNHMLDAIRGSHGALVPLTSQSIQLAATLPDPDPKAVAGHEPITSQSPQAEYDQALGEVLTAKLRSQESYEIHLAEAVASLLETGDGHQWMTNLWPVVCQTCGEPLGTKADLSADHLPGGDGEIRLSLHHSACRPSGAAPAQGTVTGPATSSFAIGCLSISGELSPDDLPPAMAINPSCEQIRLARGSDGKWRNTTLDQFAAIGMIPAAGELPPPVPQLHANLDGDQLTVSVLGDESAKWTLTPPASALEQLQRHQCLVVSVTTKGLPTLMLPEDLTSTFADPECLVGWVWLGNPRRHRRPPRTSSTLANLPGWLSWARSRLQAFSRACPGIQGS